MNSKYEGASLCREHDAYYKNGEWIEDKCGDADCEFCYNRPDKPCGKCKE